MLSNISNKHRVCKTGKILHKVQREFWDMLEQYQTKQNSIRHVPAQSLDSKFNGNITYFLYIRQTNNRTATLLHASTQLSALSLQQMGYKLALMYIAVLHSV